MAQFNADIALKVQSSGAERQVRKLERSINKVEDATRDILGVDKQIIRERKALIRLSGDQATKAKQRVRDLGLQKAELALQKRELQQITRLEKQRVANNKRASGASASGGGGGGGTSPLLLGAGVAASSVFQKGAVVGQLKADQIRISDALDATRDEVKQATAELSTAYQKYRGVVARNGGANQRSTFSRNVGVRPKVSKLRDLREGEKYLSNRLGGIDADVNNLTKTFNKAQSPASAFGRQLVGLAAAYIGIDKAARFATTSIQKSISAASSQQRIRALSEGFDNYELVLSRASTAAEKFNISQIEANNQFAQLYGRLRPLGLTLDEVSTVFEGFNTAAALTGATAAESSGALLQLSQALGAGALRGEEFNSIAEQAPAVLQAIAKEVDKPVGQLKQLAKDGKLTSDILVAALSRVKTEGADKLAAALDTPAQKVKKLENRFEDLQIALGKLTLPATIGLIDQLTTAVETSTGKIDTYTRAFEKLLSPLGAINIESGKFLEFIGKLPGEIAKSLPGIGQLIRGFEAIDFLLSGIAGEKPEVLLPPGGDDPIKPLIQRLGIDPPGGGDGTNSGGRSAADIAAEQLEQGERLSKEFSRQVALLSAKSDIERESYQIAFDRQDREEQIAKSLESQKGSLFAISDRIAAIEKIDLVTDDALTKTGDYIDLLKDGMEGLVGDVASDFADFKSETNELAAAVNQRIGGAIEDSLVQGIEAAITGAEKLEDVLGNIASDLLGSLGRMFINAGISGIGGGLGLPGYAEGGRPPVGDVSVVGERGPELFVPDTSGTVLSTQDSKAALSSYKRMSPEEQKSANTGNEDTAGNGASFNYSPQIQTTRFGDTDFVSVEQMNQTVAIGMAEATKQGAKIGEAKTLRRLRMNPTARRQVGI